MNRNWLSLVLSAVALGTAGSAFSDQTVEKVADFTFGADGSGAGAGGYAPLDRFTQVGTNLWFTTSLGGAYDLGTISRFDLTTHQVVQVASLVNVGDVYTGSKPESSLLVIGDEGYFTAVGKGVNNKGTIAKINLTSGIITTLYAFPATGLPTGYAPRAGLTQIGDDLWTTTQSGGATSGGTIVKYNLTSGLTTLVTNFDGPLLGKVPDAGFTQVGDAWYFTTSQGGSTTKTTNYPVSILPDGSTVTITNSTSNGAGTLGRVTFDSFGVPTVSKVYDVPGGASQFLYEEPTLVGTNSLYFTSTGPNSLPGAILRYDISTGFFTNLFSFSTNPIPAGLYGTRPGYSGLVEWQGELYFINRNGGTNATAPNSGGGTVAKFNIASNTVIKLADLGNPNLASDLGSPVGSGGFFGTGTIVQETNRFFLYYPLTSGGASGLGSIIRVLLPPQPIQASLTLTNDATNVFLAWSGGYPPFDVVTNSDFSVAPASWAAAITNLTSADNTTNWSVTLPAAATGTFYRIRGQAW